VKSSPGNNQKKSPARATSEGKADKHISDVVGSTEMMSSRSRVQHRR